MPPNDRINPPKLSPEAKIKLADALLACASMSTQVGRDTVLAQLPKAVTNRVSAAPTAQMQVFNLIETCLSYGAMDKLLGVVRGFEGNSDERARLDRTAVKARSFAPNILSDALFWELDSIVDIDPLPWSPAVLLEAYRRSARPSPRSATPAGRDDAELLDAILLRLADTVQRPDDGMYPILDFAAQLGLAAAKQLNADLQGWVERAAKELQIDRTAIGAAAPAPAAPANLSDPYLLVKLEPTDEAQSQFKVSAWIWRGRDSVTRLYFDDGGEKKQPTTTTDLQGMPGVLETLLWQTFTALNKNTAGLTIEIFVPYQQLGYEADRWLIPAGFNKISVGVKYPVVVRSYDRIAEKTQAWFWDAWNEKWDQFQALQAKGDPIVWVCEMQENKLLEKELSGANKVGLASLVAPDELPPVNNLSLIQRLLTSGMPIAFWLRKTADNPIVARKACRNLLAAKQLKKLPRQLWDRRRDPEHTHAHLWGHVTLLWDDPTRIPPERDSDNQLAIPPNAGKNP
jgi:hypothetical protein